MNSPHTESIARAGRPTPEPPLGMILHVKDIEAASRFYQTLGFVEAAAFPRADGELTLAILTYGASDGMRPSC